MAGKSVIAFFNHPVADDLTTIREGSLPRERLYGVVALLDRGWNVEPCDERFEGRFAQFAKKLRRYRINLVNLRALKRIAGHEVVLVKDQSSMMLTVAARLLGKRII